MTNEPLRLSSIGQITQPVTDLERAIEFYRKTLGER
jgi:catechol 2,3-dioxygenase-like lactoylglutathione lyase family enzyme